MADPNKGGRGNEAPPSVEEQKFNMQLEIADLREQAAILTTQLKVATDVVEEWSRYAADLENAVKAGESQIASLKAEAERLRAVNVSAMTSLRDLQRKLETVAEDKTTLEARLKDLLKQPKSATPRPRTITPSSVEYDRDLKAIISTGAGVDAPDLTTSVPDKKENDDKK